MTDLNTDLTGLRVLIVEDNGLLGRCLADALGDFGADVLGPIPSLARAVQCLSSDASAFSAAVLNVTIGQETSYPLVDLAEQAGVPCLFVTGSSAGRHSRAYQPRAALREARRIPALRGLPRTARQRQDCGRLEEISANGLKSAW